jgi:DnaJ-domain-containing protein 1/GTPase SAR1 family protein
MQTTKNYQHLVNTFKNTSKLLNLNSQLKNDITAICNYLINPNFRIAVFGPFNHGKSTLLNAMLGDKTLPIDLIPTTGAAITVKYGTDIRTRIMLTDGSEIYRSGTDILKQFAILDGDRRMRNDVASVEVFHPHSFLQTGIEFLDLPGTNDREAQDNLVKEQLLSVDLVVQLLDARKLMTLGERENLRDWLLDRGIKTVIFVVNFLNLLEPEEEKEVQNRLRFVAESFRAELPPGFSNLYRVDALPALRARLKGNVADSNSSGLTEFETALQNIAGILKEDRNISSPRVEAVARQLQESLKAKITPLQNEIKKINDKNQAANEIKRRAETLIKQGFEASLNKLRQWLALTNLRHKYQADAAVELAKENFLSWENNTVKKDFYELQSPLSKWLSQAYEFFKQEYPEDLIVPFPKHPQVTLPPRNGNSNDLSEPGSIAVGSGIGWLIGGPLGAAVLGSITYLVNQNLQQQDDKVTGNSYHQQVAKLCIDAVDGYLDNFSREGLAVLGEYERKANRIIRFVESAESPEIIQKREELRNWQSTLQQLNQELASCLGVKIASEYQIDVEIPKSSSNQSVYRSQGVGIKEDVGTKTAEVKQQAVKAKVEVENKPSSIPSPKSPNVAEVEAKFRNWEIDEEIAQMKAEMRVPGYQKQRNSSNQTNQTQPKVEKNEVKNAYEILGLPNNTPIADVKQAYRKLVKKWHPDLFVGKPQLLQEAQDKMRHFNEAYTILSEHNN